MSILYSAFFCSVDPFLLFHFFISNKLDLKFIWSFSPSVSFISPFFILLIRSKALLYFSSFSSGVLPLYLYIKSSRITFFSNWVILLSLLSASSLNISFASEVNGLSSSSQAYFLIALTCPWIWIAFTCFSPWSSIVFNFFFQKLYQGENK